MKICLLGDTHFGIRNDSKNFHEFYEKFYSTVLIPYLEENGIDNIVQLGDLFDRRKYINFVSLTESRRYFFDILKEKNIKLHALIGNHDIFWKHSLAVNSPDLLLRDYDNITLWQKHGTLYLGDFALDMIPWICNENEQEILDFISNSRSPYCAGHFELKGFPLMKGVESHDGTDSKFLGRYDAVYSGHYHTQSHEGNVRYLGTPYELFWSDYKDPKGFFILDTDTGKLEFVENPLRMFYKLHYDDSNEDDLKNIDVQRFSDAYVKVIVLNKQNPYLFDKMLDSLYKVNPIDVTIVEDFTEANLDEIDSDLVNQAEDTMTILSNYIDQQNVNVSTTRLKSLMREIYVEALSTENIE
jgi:DNA repair exonuclease SbcCD nuclease subunit